jgi:hypothetical protein
MPESGQVGVYFLFGEDETSGREAAYIGQTDCFANGSSSTMCKRISGTGRSSPYR